MLEKSCRWWPIWYLLFFCHGSEGELQWVVKEKITAYGQNLILFCPVENCCTDTAGWFVGPKTIIIDVKTFTNDPKVKYHGTHNKDGFGFVIRNLSEADLDVTYHCIYGFNQSTPKYLLHGDVFRENNNECLDNNGDCSQYCRNLNGSYECYCQDGLELSSDNTTCLDNNECLDNNGGCSQYCRNLGGSYECYCQDGLVLSSDNTTCFDNNECLDNNADCSQYCRNLNGSYECYCQDGLELSSDNTTCLDVPDDDKEIDTAAIVVPIVVIMVGFIIGMAYCVYRSRIKKKRQKQIGTDEETNNLCQMKNQPGTDEETNNLCQMKNQPGTDEETNNFCQMKNQPDKAEGLSKEENNCLRLYYTCQKIATQAVRLLFDREVPGHELESFVREHRLILTSKKGNCRCTKKQESILFPGDYVVVSADFDFTLQYKLIRNLLAAIPPPTCGWGNEPLPEHLNEADDIERIRSLRNYLSRNPELKIYDADFFTHWTDLSQAIDRLSKGSLSTDVESMRTKIFDKSTKNEMEEDIRKEQEQMYKDIIELQQQVDANKQDIADIKQNIVDNEQENPISNISHIELNTQSNLPMLSEKGLMYAASKLGFEWTSVALSLDITQTELEQIHLDNPCQVVKQITVALIRWRNRQCNRPQQDTIKQLIEALEVAERQDIINNLREKYGTDYI